MEGNNVYKGHSSIVFEISESLILLFNIVIWKIKIQKQCNEYSKCRQMEAFHTSNDLSLSATLTIASLLVTTFHNPPLATYIIIIINCIVKKKMIFSSNFFLDLKNVGGGGNYLKIFLNLESCPINLAIFLFSLHLFVLDHHLIQNLFPPLHLPEDVKNFS